MAARSQPVIQFESRSTKRDQSSQLRRRPENWPFSMLYLAWLKAAGGVMGILLLYQGPGTLLPPELKLLLIGILAVVIAVYLFRSFSK